MYKLLSASLSPEMMHRFSIDAEKTLSCHCPFFGEVEFSTSAKQFVSKGNYQ